MAYGVAPAVIGRAFDIGLIPLAALPGGPKLLADLLSPPSMDVLLQLPGQVQSRPPASQLRADLRMAKLALRLRSGALLVGIATTSPEGVGGLRGPPSVQLDEAVSGRRGEVCRTRGKCMQEGVARPLSAPSRPVPAQQ